MADNKDLIYERFREKVYDDFTEFKEYMLGSCPKEQVYKLAEEITFREALAFFILTGTYLEENMSAATRYSGLLGSISTALLISSKACCLLSINLLSSILFSKRLYLL